MGVINQQTASRGAPEICRGFVALDFRPCFGTILEHQLGFMSWISQATCGISPTKKSGNMTMN